MNLKHIGKSKKMDKFKNKITYIGLIMALIIVMRHSVGIDVYNMPLWLFTLERFVSFASDMVVPMFFALSGYLFFQNFSYSKLLDKWKSRAKSLVVPFIIWNIIGWGFYFVLSYLPMGIVRTELTHSMTSFPSFFKEVFVETSFNITWFLRDLIVFSYTFPVIYILLKNKYMLMGGGIFVDFEWHIL